MTASSKSQAALLQENAELRARLEEAEETLRAIRSGEVDALVMGEEVYTLKGAEAPYRLLIESMNEGAATLTPDGTILYCNRRFAEMVATPPEQVIGSCLWRWVVPAQEPSVRSLVVTARETGARAELAFSVPHGPDLHVLLSLRPIKLDSQSIGVVVADLAERKRAEDALQQAHDTLEQRVRERTEELQQANEALRESEERFRLAADATRAMVYDLDVRTMRVDTLHGLRELLGYDLSEAAMRLEWWNQHIHPEDAAKCHAAFQRMHADGHGRAIEYRIRHKDGRTLWAEDHATPVRDEAGKLVRIVGTVVDITERKRAEEELTRFNEAMIGRELRMIELKQEVNALCVQLGQPPRYRPELDEEARPTA